MPRIQRAEFDVLVVGSGGSGSRAAAEASRAGARVCLISKDPVVCSDSKISEGIVTVRGSGDPADSVDELKNNLRIQGDDLAREDIAGAFAADSADSYAWLQEHGLYGADVDVDGRPQPLGLPMGGHTRRRSIPHANGGLDYGHALSSAIMDPGEIEIIEDAWFLDVCIEEKTVAGAVKAAGDAAAGDVTGDDASAGVVCGGLIYHAATGRLLSYRAPVVILACGGPGSLYFPDTDTMRGNTGDAYALAVRAGALLGDMEQIQFLPFGIAHPPTYRGLLAGEPVSAGALGVLRDGQGRLIQGELMARTRADLAAVIARTVAAGRGTAHGGCYLDMTDNGRGQSGEIFARLLRAKVPGLMQNIRRAMGSRAANFEELWEIKPTAHYCMGGVLTDENGAAISAAGRDAGPGPDPLIGGLFACGQAMGGLHGSNRLGSTSLAECLVFGRRAGLAAARYAAQVRSLNPESESAERGGFRAAEERALRTYGRWFAEAGLLSATMQAKSNASAIGDATDAQRAAAPIQLICRLQKAVRSGFGPARDAQGLAAALREIDAIESALGECRIPRLGGWNQPLIDLLECRNMLLTARLIGESARARTRSLGAHVRVDREPPHVAPGFRGLFSVAVSLNPQSQELAVWALRRSPSPRLARLKLKARQAVRIGGLRLLRLAPFALVDRLLARIYRRAAGESVAAGVDGPLTHSGAGEGL